MDLRSLDCKTLATLAFLDAFGAEQSLLTYFADLGGPALRYPEWRWLLHTRRVPVLPDADVSQLGASVVGEKFATLPKCADIGDPAGIVWTCWPCLVDLCCKKPRRSTQTMSAGRPPSESVTVTLMKSRKIVLTAVKQTWTAVEFAHD